MENDIRYVSSSVIASRWGVSDRTVRNHARNGRIPGAFLTGKIWNIPSDAVKPLHGKRDLLSVLINEMEHDYKGGIYHRIMIDLTYNSNHMEGSRLTHDQTRYIFETRTIGANDGTMLRVDDIVETVNHFECIRSIIKHANRRISENLIKELHRTLKNGTSDSMKSWFAVGDWKTLPNEVGGIETTAPEDVDDEMKALISEYEDGSRKSLEDILSFHVAFERIHPFQDGNGRIGRLLMFKECLRHGIVPFVIDEETSNSYYRGLQNWGHVNEYLLDTCRFSEDKMEELLKYFRIDY